MLLVGEVGMAELITMKTTPMHAQMKLTPLKHC